MDLFTLVAKLTLDSSDYDKGVEDAKEKTSGLGDKLAGAAKVGGAAMVAGVGAAAAAVGSMAKKAVDAYADYEQLSGGIETLFGDSAQTVISNADKAFKTAGMSMNDYMETTISSAASLINSLEGDQAKAADLMDLSITDMADNVNKMGTSMEGVMNAYRGFSRGNFTMLDNLALGFAGTKEGMEELLKKAKELSGVDYNIDSYADIVEAIHVVQTEMGITGTTALEASETISGSMSTMQAAWENVLTSVANGNGDLSESIDGLVESAAAVASNIIPAVQTALTGLGSLVTELAPVLAQEFPKLVTSVLPSLISSAVTLAVSLGSALAENAPTIINSLVTALSSNAVTLIDGAFAMITALITGISDALPELIPSAIAAIMTIAEALTSPANLMSIIDAALSLVINLANGLVQAVPQLIQQAPILIKNLVTALTAETPQLLAAALQLIVSLSLGIIESLPELIAQAPQIIAAIVGGIIDGLGSILEVGGDIVRGLWQGIKDAWGWLVDSVKGLFGGFVDSIKGLLGIHSPSTLFAGIGDMMARGLGEGFEDTMAKVADDMEDAIPTKFGAVDVATGTTANSGATAAQQMTIGFDVDVEGLVRYLRPYLKDEDTRIGAAMVI